MQTRECIKTRRSIRKYKAEPVEHEKIVRVIEAAAMAPSWKNTQVSRFHVIESEETRKKFPSCLPEFNRLRSENAAAIIVATVKDKIAGFSDDGKHTLSHLGAGFQYFDNGLQVENLCLAARDEGLGTLIMGLYDEGKVRDLARIPDDEVITVVIALGVADESPEGPEKLSASDVAKFL